VLEATNSWLHSQTRSQYAYDKDRGYVCTLSRLVIKSTTAHSSTSATPASIAFPATRWNSCTNDHRVVISSQQSYLGRALGVQSADRDRLPDVRSSRATSSCWSTDGIYEHLSARRSQGVNDGAAISTRGEGDRRQAYAAGSEDNLTSRSSASIELPESAASEVFGQPSELPLPPLLEARHGVRRLPHRARAARLEPQPHLSRRRHRDRRRGHASRSRRSICATIPPILSAS
jgi:hypothetical protein